MTDRDKPQPPSIETPRLRPVVLLSNELAALIAGETQRAGTLASVVFPSYWPEDDAACEGLPWHLEHLSADRSQQLWRVRAIVERDTGEVVSSTSFKGPPNAQGDVEIGWGLNQNRRGREYALEATSHAELGCDAAGRPLLQCNDPRR